MRAVGSVDLNLGHCTGAEEAIAPGSHASGRSGSRRAADVVVILFIALIMVVIVPSAQSAFMITAFAVIVADQHLCRL